MPFCRLTDSYSPEARRHYSGYAVFFNVKSKPVSKLIGNLDLSNITVVLALRLC